MRDEDCVVFLQWALPTLQMRWPGFRKVRRQVCKRIGRRLQELALPSVEAYRHYLTAHPQEWDILDRMCQITISRFYRDRQVWRQLQEDVLPRLIRIAHNARAARDCYAGSADRAACNTREDLDPLAARAGPRAVRPSLNCWSVGCAAGEEPYTLALIWERELRASHPDCDLLILATDTNTELLARASEAIYPASSLKDTPADWRNEAFRPSGRRWQLDRRYRKRVIFRDHDIRTDVVPGEYDLILCRNLVFTYFTEELQHQVLRRFAGVLLPAGFLVVGRHEKLPEGCQDFLPQPGMPCFFRKHN